MRNQQFRDKAGSASANRKEAVMNFVVNTITAVYDLLWGDLFAIPLPGGGSLGISLLVLLLIPTGIFLPSAPGSSPSGCSRRCCG